MAATASPPTNWSARYLELLAGTKDANDRADAHAAQEQLADELASQQHAITRLARKAAAEVRRSVEGAENRRLKQAMLQPALFLDDLWVDCGENDRYLLGDMTIERWQKRKDLITTNFAQVALAFGTEVSWIDAQTTALQANGPNAYQRTLYPSPPAGATP